MGHYIGNSELGSLYSQVNMMSYPQWDKDPHTTGKYFIYWSLRVL